MKITADNWYWFVLIGYVLVMCLIDFAMMGIDKASAKRNLRRIPEKRLFLFAALGGALGGILGMSLFRHKTQHRSFLIGMPLLLVLNVAVFGGLAYLFLK